MSKPDYKDQYCEKHDHWFADFLHGCPICLGEEFGKQPVKHLRWEEIRPKEDEKMEDKGV